MQPVPQSSAAVPPMEGGAPDPALLKAAQDAMAHAYAPYSRFQVGAALRFADGAIVTGSNVENASYGLSLCAETVAVAAAMAQGRRGGLVEVVIVSSGEATITPCGRCRQVLSELAGLGRTDPLVWCMGKQPQQFSLSYLIPAGFTF